MIKITAPMRVKNRRPLWLLLICLSSTAIAENWPGFRGPTRQGLSRESKNPLVEKVQASPAISGRHLFIRTEKNLWCVGAK